MCANLRLKRLTHFLAAGGLAIGIISPAFADGFRFAVMGDHRGITKDTKVGSTVVYKAANDAKTAWRDGGVNWPVLNDLAGALKNEKVDFVLDVGDLVSKFDGGKLTGVPNTQASADALLSQELNGWRATWCDASDNLPVFPVRGNQEVSASVGTWLDFIGSLPGISSLARNGPPGEEGLTFSFKYKNCIFIGIDQYLPPANNDVHPITPAALEWLDGELRHSSHKFVFGHVPAFEIWDSTAAMYTAVKDGLATPYAKFTPAAMTMRDVFWNLLGQRQAEYFCGHDHLFGRGLAFDGEDRIVRQTIIGDGGAPPPIMPPPPSPYVFPPYPAGPYAETYTGIPFPTYNCPPDPAYQLAQPRIVPEVDLPDQLLPRFDEFGYVVVDVHGSKVTATYKAESATYDGTHYIGNGHFQTKAAWIISQHNGQDK